MEVKADSRVERDRLHEVQPEGRRGHAPSTVPPRVGNRMDLHSRVVEHDH
jgi:hypothetical protein